jgi:hypothetical protein
MLRFSFINYLIKNPNIWFNSKPEDDKKVRFLFMNIFYEFLNYTDLDIEKLSFSDKIIYIITLEYY